MTDRTSINPWDWSIPLGFNQAELVTGTPRTLYCSGQTSMSADGLPQHPDDVAAQLSLSLDNLESVLRQAGMSLANLVRLTVFTTDVDALMPHYGILASRLAGSGSLPASSTIGVTRLAVPGLLVELEATAVAH